MSLVETEVLWIDAEVAGPAVGPAALLLHGWPDAPVGWQRVAAAMHAARWRTITPCLRGSGGIRFVSIVWTGPWCDFVVGGLRARGGQYELADASDRGCFRAGLYGRCVARIDDRAGRRGNSHPPARHLLICADIYLMTMRTVGYPDLGVQRSRAARNGSHTRL